MTGATTVSSKWLFHRHRSHRQCVGGSHKTGTERKTATWRLPDGGVEENLLSVRLRVSGQTFSLTGLSFRRLSFVGHVAGFKQWSVARRPGHGEAGQHGGAGTRADTEWSPAELWQLGDAGSLTLQGWSGSDCDPCRHRAAD